MTKTKFLLVGAMLTVGLGSVGCSSSSSCADGGICDTGGAGGTNTGAGGTAGPVLYALTPGTYCFDVLSVAAVTDGCDIGVAAAYSMPGAPFALPVTYDMTARTVSVGTQGSLGIGLVDQNVGTLMRDNMPTLAAPNQACTWRQTDTSSLQLTGDNKFTLSVSETQSAFAGATTCAAANMPVPAAGSCTSTWTWSLAIENPVVFSPPACGNPQ
jgi:hypothetical protein